jgi:phospholipid/cholesterol/gamma-HCH transport system ATP-binding protein
MATPPEWLDDDDHIVCDHVSKSFGRAVVLADINIRFKRHETAVLIGGSGSGKTTLARLLVALDQPTSGRVWLNGEEIWSLTENDLMRVRKRLGMVFQHHALFGSLTALDNVAFPLREHGKGMSHSEIEQRAVAALHEVGLQHREGRLPAELSGGERKRVSVARALILEPELVVYDEPTSGLDPAASRAIDHLIAETRRRRGVTSVVITHDMATCFRVADRVHVLDQGRVVGTGTPHELANSVDARCRELFSDSGVREGQLAHLRPA